MKKTEFILSENDEGRRLDRVIRKFLADIPLPAVYTAIRKGLIRVNGSKAPFHYRTAEGDTLTIAEAILSTGAPAAAIPDNRQHTAKQKAHKRPCCETSQPPPDIPLLLAAKDLFIINKPAGISVHGGGSIDTLLSDILSNAEQSKGLSFKPGPLHRLDKNTTGVLCFSRTLTGAQWFSRCLWEKTVDKRYLGVVRGRMPAQTIATTDEHGKTVTQCYALKYNDNIDASLMMFRLITGKKHQIRKHMMHAGHPLAGDRRYHGGGPLPHCTRYLLHAWRLSFPESRPADIPASIEAPFFPEMEGCLNRFFPHWEKAVKAALPYSASPPSRSSSPLKAVSEAAGVSASSSSRATASKPIS